MKSIDMQISVLLEHLDENEVCKRTVCIAGFYSLQSGTWTWCLILFMTSHVQCSNSSCLCYRGVCKLCFTKHTVQFHVQLDSQPVRVRVSCVLHGVVLVRTTSEQASLWANIFLNIISLLLLQRMTRKQHSCPICCLFISFPCRCMQWSAMQALLYLWDSLIICFDAISLVLSKFPTLCVDKTELPATYSCV